MDRTSWIGLIFCILLLIGWNLYVSQKYPPSPRPPVTQQPPNTPAPADTPHSEFSPLQQKLPPTLIASPSTSTPAPSLPPPQILTLENEHLLIEVTSHGGGIQKAQLKQHTSDKDTPIVFTSTQSTPILATHYEGTPDVPALYTLTQSIEQGRPIITATREVLPGLILTRTITLQDHYNIHITHTLRNTTSAPITVPVSKWHLGHAAPTYPQDRPEFVGAGWLDAQARYHKNMAQNFDGFSLLGIQFSSPRAWTDTGATPPLWVSLKNQYFVLLVLPDENKNHLTRTEFRPVVLPHWKGKTYGPAPRGVRADMIHPESILAPGALDTQSIRLYIGPKEYNIVKSLGIETEKIMEFGFFSWLVKPLLHTMNAIYKALALIPPLQSYGLAIALLAILVKLILWPLQSAANRSMKKMQALAPKMKEIQEKYKDDPTKMQTEVMKLYTDYGVNPIGGCLPVLPQIPIFIAFYTMLQHAIEIRHSSFLWVSDLSRPDTIYTLPILGLDINPLPIIMTATSIFLMHMTPMTTENQQYKIMRWLPLIFIPIFYGFPSALSLYWTVNNFISIIQTHRNLKKPIPVLKRVERKPNSRLAMFQKALEEQRRIQQQQQAKKKK